MLTDRLKSVDYPERLDGLGLLLGMKSSYALFHNHYIGKRCVFFLWPDGLTSIRLPDSPVQVLSIDLDDQVHETLKLLNQLKAL